MATLRFTLRSERGEDEAVDARDFAKFLSAVLACLGALEEHTAAQAPVEYRITDLQTGSAAIEIQPASTGDLDRSADAVAESFALGFDALQRRALRDVPFSRKVKSRFIALAKPLKKRTRSIELISSFAEPVLLSRRTPVVELPPVKTEAVSRGSLKGAVDALNVHNKPVFYIYPKSGPLRVKCTFDAALLDDLRQAIKRNTTAYGLMEYEPGNPFPTSMFVERVEVNGPDSALPSMASLFGAAPHLTGDKGTAEFLNALRDVY